jgi:hypothetical protein
MHRCLGWGRFAGESDRTIRGDGEWGGESVPTIGATGSTLYTKQERPYNDTIFIHAYSQLLGYLHTLSARLTSTFKGNRARRQVTRTRRAEIPQNNLSAM